METTTKTVEQSSEVVCPFNALLVTLGKPHTLEILYALHVKSPMRFGEIQAGIKVQPKTLTSRLHELVALKLVDRVSYNEIPPRVDYSLTQKGRDMGRMFKGLNEWAAKYDSGKTAEPANPAS